MRISAWGSDVCSSDLIAGGALVFAGRWALDHWDWLDGTGLALASALLVVVLIAGSWLLFRAVAIAVVGLFADAIVADVEARHYPAPAPRAVHAGRPASLPIALPSAGRPVLRHLSAQPFHHPLPDSNSFGLGQS